MYDKVSVIIPTRNRSKLLERSISSIMCQNYDNLEVIVSNNASTDNTKFVLEGLKNKYSDIVIVEHKSLLTLSDHWSTVINKYVTGEYILLIPDDDILIDNDYIQKAVNILKKYDSVGLVFANYFIVNECFERISSVNAQFEEFITKEFLFTNYNSKLFGIEGIGISHLTTVFSKKAYNSVQGFDLNCMCPDTYLWLKILLKYDAGFVNEKVAEYLIHQNNLSNMGNVKYQYLDTKIIKTIKKYSKKNRLYKDFMDSTFQRISNIFYKRFYGTVFKNIANSFKLTQTLYYFFKSNPYNLLLILMEKFKKWN
jgi:glycosyltransferase involved in cell wall biosynthesis